MAKVEIEQEVVPATEVWRDVLQRADKALGRMSKGLRAAAFVGLIAGITTASQAREGIIETPITQPTEGTETTLEVSAAQIPPAPEIAKVVFREDFNNPELLRWSVRPGKTGRVTTEDGWLKLEADYGSTFPVVERKDIFPTEGSFEVNFRLDFPEKTGYGTYFTLIDEDDMPILNVGGGRCANPFVRLALNNGEEVNPFMIFSNEAYNNGWDGPLGNPDIPHKVSFYYDGQKEIGYFAVDDVYIGKLSELPRPLGVRMGNPETTAQWGDWTKIGVDFVEVRQSLKPSFSIPEAPPPHNLLLFQELDGQKFRTISSLALPPKENWALEIEAKFSNFSLEKPVLIQVGDLEILSSKGWEPFVALSAGKEGEKFGFLIYSDVGKREEGKESLRRPKAPHIIRLVHLNQKEYLYVDGILVGQGPGEKITGKIPVGISEETDGTKVDIESMKLFSVSP